MKDSREYSKKTRKLYQSLKRKGPKVEKMVYEEPADAIVYAIVSEHLKEKAAQEVQKRFNVYFVDLNDLRVSRIEEIGELIGGDIFVARGIASAIRGVLGGVFNKYHKMSLEALKKMGKRPARMALEKMEGTSPFVVDYCMVTALQGHAIPLTKGMVAYLKQNELVSSEADEQEIGGFLAKQIPAKDGFEFYSLLRRESEAHESGRKRDADKAQAGADLEETAVKKTKDVDKDKK
jgi:endonuclease III